MSHRHLLSVAAFLATVIPASAADPCVTGRTDLERSIATHICREMEGIGVVRSRVELDTTKRTVSASAYFPEGTTLEGLSDPTREDLLVHFTQIVDGLEQTAVELAGMTPHATSFAIFSTAPNATRPRIVYGRKSPGAKVEVVSASDGVVEKPTPRKR